MRCDKLVEVGPIPTYVKVAGTEPLRKSEIVCTITDATKSNFTFATVCCFSLKQTTSLGLYLHQHFAGLFCCV
jgi:hypothetical protein